MDDNKKPGARDISDLKARLGLKKTGTMATVTATGEPTAPPMPGAAHAPIPSPFGAPAPAPAAPAAPPDPRRDPFAQQHTQQAANLAAFYGYGQALPGSAEGGEQMEKKKPWALIGAVAGGCLVAFFFGTVWGGVSKARVDLNETTDQAIVVRNEVDKMQKGLDAILVELRKSDPATGGLDVDQAARLGALDLKKPNTVALFHANYQHLETLEIDRLFTYYNDTIKLYDAIASHAKKTAADKDSIANFLNKSKSSSDKNYGVLIDVSSPIPTAQFVEVGAPICPQPGQTDCKPDELKFQYRTDAGQAWSQKAVKGKPGETLTPLKQTPLFKTVATGSVDAIAAEAYGRRKKEIFELVGELDKTSKELLPALHKTAERPKVFTF